MHTLICTFLGSFCVLHLFSTVSNAKCPQLKHECAKSMVFRTKNCPLSSETITRTILSLSFSQGPLGFRAVPLVSETALTVLRPMCLTATKKSCVRDSERQNLFEPCLGGRWSAFVTAKFSSLTHNGTAPPSMGTSSLGDS